ncbi:M48 family metallopeptidase [Chondromyces apiculatus]|uniref:Peptidase M48 domain-containing protein n=1 Tax=Chondromyces apiculatus DSM 436 TaxID=1192034 RepID=A0A017SX43_9BACT|nr:M48 family metallopeptidase [Chondromyces apiculatus]EYF01347.1 Hypothetical protein CAP_8389 [Chondromyces apiculatus DSM 436]
MAQVGTLDFKAFIERRKELRAGGSQGGGHAYAYTSDHKTRRLMEKGEAVERAVTVAVRFLEKTWKSELLGHAVKVGPNQIPRIHRLAVRCADTLGIAVPTIYIVNSPHMNAATYGTNTDSFIMVHAALIDHFTDDELLSVIGHECGHIHNSHVVYMTALRYLAQVASVFDKRAMNVAMLALAGWSRRAEVTCDRAGLLCVQDVEVSSRALMKLALGSTKLYDELNLESFLAQYKESRGGIGRFAEITANHPWLPARVLALQAFAESELYRRHAGIGGGGASMQDVDTKVHEIIKILG